MDKEFVQSSELPNFDYAMPNIKDDLISKFKSQVSRLNEIQLSRLTRVSESRLEELSHQLDEFLKQIET